MKTRIGGILLLFFLSVSGLMAQTDDGDSEHINRIYWNDWYKLEWSDFMADPQDDARVAALSSIGLPYKYKTDGEGELDFTINVCFIKNESWSKDEQRNNLLLQHEQIHFDIAELHRRKIVKAVLDANFTKSNYKEKLNEIIERIWRKEYRAMQDRYDKETNYSKVIKEQINWNKYVYQQLRNYEDYTFTEVKVSLINFEDEDQ